MAETTESCAGKIRRRLMQRHFAGPVIENSFRGAYVEEMVALALEPEWKHCGAGWSGWDLESADGQHRIEVKQSALKQIWAGPEKMGSYPVKPALGYFKGAVWCQLAKPQRLAQIYVFAFHPGVDETANHTDPAQWEFRVVPSGELPEQQNTIAVAIVRRKWPSVSYDSLKSEVMRAAGQTPASPI